MVEGTLACMSMIPQLPSALSDLFAPPLWAPFFAVLEAREAAAREAAALDALIAAGESIDDPTEAELGTELAA